MLGRAGLVFARCNWHQPIWIFRKGKKNGCIHTKIVILDENSNNNRACLDETANVHLVDQMNFNPILDMETELHLASVQ